MLFAAVVVMIVFSLKILFQLLDFLATAVRTFIAPSRIDPAFLKPIISRLILYCVFLTLLQTSSYPTSLHYANLD